MTVYGGTITSGTTVDVVKFAGSGFSRSGLSAIFFISSNS